MNAESTTALAKRGGKTTGIAVPEGSKGTSVLARLALKFGVEPGKMMDCLKATAFKGPATNEQIMALCIVADQYGLNPWTKEIYAFPDKNNGIVPVVGLDGWSRIINSHPGFDGMEFETEDPDFEVTCRIYRKDRSRPVSVTEYMDECKRSTGPWGSHPRRMLRHKAMIQCARVAFGFAGIKDPDEAERIVEAEVGPAPYKMPTRKDAKKEIEEAAEPSKEETPPPADEDLPYDG